MHFAGGPSVVIAQPQYELAIFRQASEMPGEAVLEDRVDGASTALDKVVDYKSFAQARLNGHRGKSQMCHGISDDLITECQRFVSTVNEFAQRQDARGPHQGA